MALRLIDADALRRTLPMPAAIDALEAAFAAGSLPEAPPRSRLPIGEADLLAMPAAGPAGAGVKLVTVNPANPGRGLPLIHAVYVLFEPGSLAPAALLDGSALTALRTAAVSGVATRHLARRDASRLVVFGAGVQARSHVEAMAAVRPIREVTIVSRTGHRAEALAEAARSEGLAARVGTMDAVAEADVVCTCTTSSQPVLDGELLKPGAHVNAVGAYRPEARELDDATVRRARGRIVVETLDAALTEAGDLLIPLASGAIAKSDIAADLAELAAGADVRRSDDDITLFKSVGVAFEDLVVARAAVERLPT